MKAAGWKEAQNLPTNLNDPINFDDAGKNLKREIPVIPAEAGIQFFRKL